MMGKPFSVPAEPYDWPFDGPVARERMALIVIDMQVDFCGPGGYIDSQGIDLSNTRRAIPAIARTLAAARGIPGMLIIHTREGILPQLKLQDNYHPRSKFQ